MNRQDIIDIVKPKLMAQTRPAFDGENCQYLTDTGESCFAGLLMENPPLGLVKPVRNLKVRTYLPEEVLEHLTFLARAQSLHDAIAEDWYRGEITEEEAKESFAYMFASLEKYEE